MGMQLFSLNKSFNNSPHGCETSTGSCRIQGDSSHVASNQSYGVYGNVKTGKGTGKYGMGIEITSGGPGSNKGTCCGISIGIKADTMKPFIATEDWTEPNICIFAIDHNLV